jgi:hypothetical protein
MVGRWILAVEGGRFSKYSEMATPVALLFTEGIRPRKLMFKSVEVDGTDATRKLLEAVDEEARVNEGEEKEKGRRGRISLVMSSSVPIAGFNLIDAREILARLGVPTVFVLPEMPDFSAVESALRKHFKDWRARLEVIAGAGAVAEFDIEGERLRLECVGITQGEAIEIVRRLTIFGNVPEPIRIARMACRALTG